MFTIYHIIWLVICLLMIFLSLHFYKKYQPSLQEVLTIACIISVLSEIAKVISVIKMVPSTNGTIIYPYMELNHLPLHFCSIHILLIFYTRFTSNQKVRENVLAFMYPTCIIGAFLALMMPSIFTTSIEASKAFVSLISYQFFIYHSMLIALGIIIVKSKEIKWQKKHLINTLVMVFVLGFVSIYLNSLLASPTYVDGKLVSVDFWTNFFFTYQNPLNIKLTQIWQWYIYILIISALAIILISLFFYPLIKKDN